jgi:hypothetical protein
MMHFDSRRSQACEDMYGDVSSTPPDSTPLGESMQRVFFLRRNRRPGFHARRRYFVQLSTPNYQLTPVSEVPETPEVHDEPEELEVIDPLIEDQHFLERRMDAAQSLGEAIIFEVQQMGVVEELSDIL